MAVELKIYKGGQLPTLRHGRMLIFGPTGSGKSSFGGTMPGRRVVLAADRNASLPLEAGFERVPRAFVPKGEKNRKPALFIECPTWAHVDAALSWLEQNTAEYDSIVIDSGTELNVICKRAVLAERQESLERGWKKTGASGKKLETLDMQGWGLLAERMETLRFRLHQLPAHICWICGYLPPKAAREDGGSAVTGGPDLSPTKLAIRFPYACDVALFLQRDVDGDGAVRVRAYSRFPDVDAKDNRGVLDQFEPADGLVILSRLGYMDAATTAMIDKACPRRTAEQQAAADAGLDL